MFDERDASEWLANLKKRVVATANQSKIERKTFVLAFGNDSRQVRQAFQV